MKNLQIWFLKFLITISFFSSFPLANAQSQKIKTADSLFRSKQYTQSLELYQTVLREKEYSPSMLLKMAYIQEGLGRIGLTLYYLKLYQLATSDEQATRKMEELAAKFRLSGYDSNDANPLQLWIDENKRLIQGSLGFVLMIMSCIIYLQKSRNQKPWAAICMIVLVSSSLLYLNNFHFPSSVIVGNDHTYLMEGPSSGAPVAGILGEGNHLESLGQEDVWVKVKWMDKIVYVKKTSVMSVAL